MQARGFPARPASIQEAASHVSVHPDTIRRRISSGDLKAYRLGKRLIRIDLDEVEALFRSIPTVEKESA